MFTKQISFLCALPRTGATFLGSIINQSKQIQMTANSIVPALLENIFLTKESTVFKNFPYHVGIDNVMLKTFDNYYDNLKCTHILDKAPWGTPFNLEMLRCIFKKRKFVILIRPVLECLASFVKNNKRDKGSLEDFCNGLMDREKGILGKNIWSINNLIKEGEEYIVITYNDLINHTEKEINKIFNFLELKEEKFNLKNLKQFNFDNVYYNDKVVAGDYHIIRTKNIKKIKYDIKNYLSKEIINKYENIDIWPSRFR
jgi:hypothetical protein